MILAEFSWLSASIYTLVGVFAIVCLLMSTVVLMQRPKNEGLGAAFGSGTTDQLFGARTTNVLQKSTVWLATIFFILVLVLSILLRQRNKIERSKSLVQPVVAEAVAPVAPVTSPVTLPTTVPATGTGLESPQVVPVDPVEVPTAPPVDPGTVPALPAPAPAPPADEKPAPPADKPE